VFFRKRLRQKPAIVAVIFRGLIELKKEFTEENGLKLCRFFTKNDDSVTFYRYLALNLLKNLP
jgi:hypothetical protein